MIEVTASADLPAPPERVWEVLSDTASYAEWIEGTDEVTRTDGPAAPGSTYDEVNPIAGPIKAKTHWTVTEYEAPRRQVHESGDIMLTKLFTVTMEVEPAGAGSRASITLRGEPSLGPFGSAFLAAMKPGVEKDNRRSMENLAARLAR